MSKYQALIDALNGDDSLFSNVRNGDIRALLADLEMAEKALAALAQQAQEPVASQPFARVCSFNDIGGEYELMSPPSCRPPVGAPLYTTPQPQPAPLAAYAPNDTLPPKGDSVAKIVPDVAPTRDYLPGMWDESDLLGGATDMPSKPPAPLAGEVTDERLLSEWDRVSHIAEAGNRRLAFARAILALRPAVEPMTEWEIADIFERWDNTSGASMSDFVRMVEAHHGITAKAEGGV